ncbi:MAG: hypothetical protein WEG36_09040 [Gemmatimonadota bacterium]
MTAVPTLALLAPLSPVHGLLGAGLAVAAGFAILRLPSFEKGASVRATCALTAALHAGFLALGIHAVGPDGIHLGALESDPLAFHLLHAVPLLGTLGFAAVAVLPRLIQVNLALLIALGLGVETVLGLMPPPWPIAEGEPEPVDARSYYEFDEVLSYVVSPAVTARHRSMVDGEVAYDVTYRIDSLGRRETPGTGGRSSDRFLLFFGDSNTFGEGLNQEETLPAAVASMAGDSHPYNYGMHGYGPTQALDLLDVRDLASEVAERRGIAIYTFIPAHMGRVVGSSQVAPVWGKGFSYYELGAAGEPVRLGSFFRARPLRTLAQHYWNRSNILSRFGLVLPLRYGDGDFVLTARILRTVADRLQPLFEEVDFYVVMAPVSTADQAETVVRLKKALEAEQVPVIDLSGIVDFSERRWRVADDDWHHSGALNRVLAEALVERLSLGK